MGNIFLENTNSNNPKKNMKMKKKHIFLMLFTCYLTTILILRDVHDTYECEIFEDPYSNEPHSYEELIRTINRDSNSGIHGNQIDENLMDKKCPLPFYVDEDFPILEEIIEDLWLVLEQLRELHFENYDFEGCDEKIEKFRQEYLRFLWEIDGEEEEKTHENSSDCSDFSDLPK